MHLDLFITLKKNEVEQQFEISEIKSCSFFFLAQEATPFII